MPMTAALKRKWMAALRSGKYLQGRGELHLPPMDVGEPEKWCCLGVLADITNCRIKLEQAFLTKYQLKNLGLSDGAQRGLAEMNDLGSDFETIAGQITLGTITYDNARHSI